MKPQRFRKIAVIGVGLMGGSLALACRKRRLAVEVLGYDKDPRQARTALRRGALDRSAASLEEACAGADLILLAAPVASLEALCLRIAKLAPTDCIVSDLGSVKGPWALRWEKASKPLRYLGSHPMAGSEKSGAQNARGDLFVEAPCLLTPTPQTPAAVLRRLRHFWSDMGCRVSVCSPQEHDRMIALFSHVTHLLAYAQVRAATRSLKAGDFRLAGPSYRNSARLAASNAALWAQIFEFNRPALLQAARDVSSEMERLLRLKGKPLENELAKIRRSAQRTQA